MKHKYAILKRYDKAPGVLCEYGAIGLDNDEYAIIRVLKNNDTKYTKLKKIDIFSANIPDSKKLEIRYKYNTDSIYASTFAMPLGDCFNGHDITFEAEDDDEALLRFELDE